MKLLKLPENDIADVVKSLRNLADNIDNGEYGDAHNLAWVIDCGDSRIEFGLIGQSTSHEAEFNLLLDLAKLKLLEEI